MRKGAHRSIEEHGIDYAKRIGNSPIQQLLVGVIPNNVAQSYTGNIIISREKGIGDCSREKKNW